MSTRTAPTVEVDPKRLAWGHVADGYVLAVAVPGLDEEERAELRRHLRRVERLAWRRPVRLVEPDSVDNVVRLDRAQGDQDGGGD